MAGIVVKLTEEENIVLSAQVVRRLIGTKNGDACLLYLCLKRSGDAMDGETLCAALSWDLPRMEDARRVLADAGLVQQTAEVPAAPVRSEQLPEYSDEDVMRRLERDADFTHLLRETERKLGPLPTAGVKILLGLRDHLGLPGDVVFLLINDCIARKEERFGAGRRPTMREIEKVGYAWARQEIFSVDAAEQYLKKLERQRGAYPEYLRVLQVFDRRASATEEKYIAGWMEMGFPPETIAVAYDKTVLKCHEFRWPYCNGILKKWHEKGLHTPEEVQHENETDRKRTEAAEQKTPSRKAGMSRYI